MKMLMIVYNSAIDEEVMEAVAVCEIAGYTKWEKVFGKGTASGIHLGTDIWPGENSALLIALPEEKAANLIAEIKKLRAKLGPLGIKAFTWQLEEVT